MTVEFDTVADACVLVLNAVFIADLRFDAVPSVSLPLITLYTVTLAGVVVVVPLLPVVKYLNLLVVVAEGPVFIVIVRYSSTVAAFAPPDRPLTVILLLRFDPLTIVSL